MTSATSKKLLAAIAISAAGAVAAAGVYTEIHPVPDQS